VRWLGDVQRARVGVGFFGGCGGPGREEFEGVVGGRCGFGGVDENSLDGRADAHLARAAGGAARCCGAYQVEDVGALGVMELQRAAMASRTSCDTPVALPRSRRV
jgi:hypothetical protein